MNKDIGDVEERINERWEYGTSHNIEAKIIARAIEKYLPDWDIKFGGDGDNGEELQYALSLWIEDGKPNFIPPYDTD